MKKLLITLTTLFLVATSTFAQREIRTTIYFDDNSSVVSTAEQKKIDSVITASSTFNSSGITLVGHTDAVGTSAFNDSLSAARTLSVETILNSKGIPSSIITRINMGESSPAANNGTEKGRALNRRVEIWVKQIIVPTFTPAPLPVTDRAPVVAPPVEVTLKDGPNIAGGYGLNVITNTSQMEQYKLTTMTREGQPLISNVMACISSAPRDSVKAPVVVLIPATSNPYCKFPDVELYDSQSDSTDDDQIKWMPLLNPDLKPVVINGVEYFEWTVPPGTPAGTCKNGDCTTTAGANTARIKMSSKKYQVVSLSVIYPKENALLRGHAVENGQWEFKYFSNDSISSPQIKVVMKDRHNRLYVANESMHDLKKSRKGYYILKKKMFIPKA